VAFLFAKKYMSFSKSIDRFWLKKLFDYGKFAMGTNFFTMLFKNVDKTLLGRFLKDSVSTYDLALKVNQLAEVPTMTLALILFPQSARRNTEGGDTKAAAKYLYEKSVGVLLALIIPMTVGVLLFADVIVMLIGSAKYANAAIILRMTVFYSIFSAYAIQFGTMLDSIQKPNLNFYITTLSAVVNLGCNWFFIARFGFYGAAYGTLIGMTLMFIVMQLVLHRTIGTQPFNAFIYMISFYREIFVKIKLFLINRFATSKQRITVVRAEEVRVEIIDQNAPLLRGWVNDDE
jgi:O-antigen/teichoic acid export membrane protein